MFTSSAIPKVNPSDLCEAWKLCSVREKNNEYLVAVKRRDGTISEIPLKEVVDADTYEDSPIVRTYSSGHVFLAKDCDEVFLVTVDKNGKIQHQFTWGSPSEKEFSDIIYKDKNDKNGKIKVNITKVEDNAIQRTLNRTWVEVIEPYNDQPLVDRVLMEQEDESGKTFWRMVLLMHFVVKSYTWELGYTGAEHTVGGKWYAIDELPTIPHIAANAHIVTQKARELVLATKKMVW